MTATLNIVTSAGGIHQRSVTHGYYRNRQGKKTAFLTDGTWFYALYDNMTVRQMIGLHEDFMRALDATNPNEEFLARSMKALRMSDDEIQQFCRRGQYVLL